jgi:hypothetical protein
VERRNDTHTVRYWLVEVGAAEVCEYMIEKEGGITFCMNIYWRFLCLII